MKIIGNIGEWSWGEMTSSSNGKTSASSTSGVVIILVGLIGFLITIWFSKIEFVYASVGVITLGTGLLGYNKKVTGDIIKTDLLNPIPEPEIIEENPEIIKEV